MNQPAPKPTKSARSDTQGPGDLRARTPLILRSEPDEDYALLDSGGGLKLERYGPHTIVRPEAQALWRPELNEAEWARADAVFTSDKDEDGEGIGRWRFPKSPLGETWPMAWQGLSYLGRLTSFRHVGVFPEQAAHWRFIEEQVAASLKGGHQPRMLNLFGYTGLASLVAARAGAHVTHVDASKKAIGWARENQEMAKLGDKPIRWICDDAVKFCEREIRRGKDYDAIILDPPKYGRGPKGEIWQLFEALPAMMEIVRQLMSDRPLFVVLTAYSIRASFFALDELMRQSFADMNGDIQSGELVIATRDSDRVLSTSLFSRWVAERGVAKP